MRSATGVVVHEHARFFTNTRGISNILYDASSPSPSPSSRIAHRVVVVVATYPWFSRVY
jgi:hypothetical protein